MSARVFPQRQRFSLSQKRTLRAVFAYARFERQQSRFERQQSRSTVRLPFCPDCLEIEKEIQAKIASLDAASAR